MVKGTFCKISFKKIQCFEEESYEIAKDFWRIWVAFFF
jgi:hypothetical protein